MDLDETLVECADRLQGWDTGHSRFGTKEILAWWRSDGRPAFAFRGDALRIEAHCFGPNGINNHEHYLDMSMQRSLGLDPGAEFRGYRVVYLRRQTMEAPTSDIGVVLDGIEQAVSRFFEEQGHEVYPHVTLMPSEGEPWNFDDDSTPYYNAKRKKFFSSPRPGWITTVRVMDQGVEVDTVGADFCSLMGKIESSTPIEAGVFDGYENGVLLTHCFGFDRGVTGLDMADFINGCGGFLFPSLALGPIPAANFGPVCLVFDLGVALEAMKPYRTTKGRWPIITYTTDIWTSTMRDFLGSVSSMAFEQLTGLADYSYYVQQHMFILGPAVDMESGPVPGVIIKSTKQLRGALKKRAKYWRRGLTNEQIEEYQFAMEDYRYPYLESKSNSIIDPGAIVGCFYPVELERDVHDYLDAIGVRPKMLALDIPYNPLDRSSVYEYSWVIHDAWMEEAHVQQIRLG